METQITTYAPQTPALQTPSGHLADTLPVREENTTILLTKCKTIIADIYRYCGFNISVDDIKFLGSKLAEILSTSYKNISAEEAHKAIKDGIDAVATTDKLLPTYLAEVKLRHYLTTYNTSQRRAQIAQEREAKTLQVHIPTPEEDEQAGDKLCLNAYKHYLSTDDIFTAGGHVFNHLLGRRTDEHGKTHIDASKAIIKLSKDESARIFNEAKSRIETQAKSHMHTSTVSPAERNDFKRVLAQIQDNAISHDLKAQIQLLAQEIALREFFKSLIDFNMDLSELLERKNK
ncbi:MAG: hypothetical protein PHD21_08695 [Flavobacteriales bacterium]|nr:hypothetical protein [Flavobacteriales bacterium]